MTDGHIPPHGTMNSRWTNGDPCAEMEAFCYTVIIECDKLHVCLRAYNVA